MTEVFPYIASTIVGVLSAVLTYLASEHATRQKAEEYRAKTAEAHTKQLEEFKSDVINRIDNYEHNVNKNINELYDAVTKIQAACQEQIAITTTKLDMLERKQDKHNNLIERTFKLEERASVLEEKIDVANHRILDLEHEGGSRHEN